MELRIHELSNYMLVLAMFSFSWSNASDVIDVGGKPLSRGTDRGMAYAKFKVHKFSLLNITNIGSDYVLKGSECGLACVNIPSCFSFNLAAFGDIINGKILCELLPSDIYNNSKKFVASQFHHHYSIESPCISWPCQNNGKCAAHYEKNSYVCVCDKGYTGKYCETDVDECADGSNTCDVNAYCNNTVGSYNCTCKPKYYGNGEVCKLRINESDIVGSLDRNRYLGKLMSYLDPVLHSNCDGKGPTVTIIQVNDYIFGGYTDVSWNSSSPCTYSSASKAFIFSLYNTNGYAPVKLTQYDDIPQQAMYHCSTYGPHFTDIQISNDALNNNASLTHCGHTYTAPPGHSRHFNCPFFAGSIRFSPTDIEVYYETLA